MENFKGHVPQTHPNEHDDLLNRVIITLRENGYTNVSIAKIVGISERNLKYRIAKLNHKKQRLQDLSDALDYLLEFNSTDDTGDITELEVDVALLKKGFDVFKAYTDNHTTDRFILYGKSVVKIQIKKARFSTFRKTYIASLVKKKKNVPFSYETEAVDFFIIKCPNDFYIIPSDKVNVQSINLYPHRPKERLINGDGYEVYKNAFSLIAEKLGLHLLNIKIEESGV